MSLTWIQLSSASFPERAISYSFKIKNLLECTGAVRCPEVRSNKAKPRVCVVNGHYTKVSESQSHVLLDSGYSDAHVLSYLPFLTRTLARMARELTWTERYILSRKISIGHNLKAFMCSWTFFNVWRVTLESPELAKFAKLASFLPLSPVDCCVTVLLPVQPSSPLYVFLRTAVVVKRRVLRS